MKTLFILAVLALVLASAGTAAVTVLTGATSAHADGCSGSNC